MRTGAIAILAVLPLAAQRHGDRDWKLDEKETIRRTFDAPGSGRKLLVDTISGFIHVTGTAGSQVQVAVEKHIYADSPEAVAEAKRDIKLDMDQQGSFVRLYEDGPFRSNNGVNYRGDQYYGYRVAFDFEIQVPFDMELILKTINQGDIQVKKVTGDYDINGLNGGIEMDEVSGSGRIHTLNGKLRVAFTRNPTRATTFKTLNGSIDAYFQSPLNAELAFKRLNGAIYTDFEVTARLLGAASGSSSAGSSSEGRFIYRDHGAVGGRAGSGGPELSFETLNGTIRLHSAGKTF